MARVDTAAGVHEVSAPFLDLYHPHGPCGGKVFRVQGKVAVFFFSLTRGGGGGGRLDYISRLSPEMKTRFLLVKG